jgi:murein DD-endopeptidase MepM/ murein hydrolase activator NlpD
MKLTGFYINILRAEGNHPLARWYVSRLSVFLVVNFLIAAFILTSYVIIQLNQFQTSEALLEENFELRAQLQDIDQELQNIEHRLDLIQLYTLQIQMAGTGPWSKRVVSHTGFNLNPMHVVERLSSLKSRMLLIEPSLQDAATQAADVQAQFMVIPKIWPSNGIFTSPYGWRRSPISGRRKFHAGLDIAGPHGTPIYAPSAGLVITKERKSGYGRTLEIDHGYGVISRYAHNQSIQVKLGDYVEIGQLIAKVGSSGQVTGPHLHFEVLINGIPVDPAQYLPKR